MPIDYVVVPTSNIDYQTWQIKLLDWSRRKVKQKGKFILLNSLDIEGREIDSWYQSDTDMYVLPNWAKEWTDKGHSWWGGIPNKYNGLKWMCDNLDIEDHETILFLDPDMIFADSVDLDVGENEVVGTKWFGYVFDDKNKCWLPEFSDKNDFDLENAFMYPFAIRFGTLKKIVDTYCDYCVRIRIQSEEWISEMYALDSACKIHGVKVKYEDNLAHCTAWWNAYGLNEMPSIIHFPNIVYDKSALNLWFKQDFTTNQDKVYDFKRADTGIGRELVKSVSEYQTDYFYWFKYDYPHLFDKYDGSGGYIVCRPWPGGFNNIRMSFEIAVCLSFLTNRTLVLPPTYNMYLLEGGNNLGDFFDLEDLGIETIEFSQFCNKYGIGETFEDIEEKFGKIGFVNEKNGNDETADLVLAMDKIDPPDSFKKWKRLIRWSEHVDDSSEVLYFDKNLLGNWYQLLYTSKDKQLKQLIARHVHFTKELFDKAWEFISILGDRDYYAMHIRGNDFQYKQTRVSAKDILENVKDRIPEASKVYIATDHKDKSFFKELEDYYNVYYYDDYSEHLGEVDPDHIPMIEKLICTRAITFIGHSHSTLSSYIHRLRGYMSDIKDDEYHLTTEKYNIADQTTLQNARNFIANWFREFKDAWDLEEEKIFVSIASYMDGQVDKTIQSCIDHASNPSRIFIGVGLQHTKKDLDKLREQFEDNPNVAFLHYDPEEVRSVVDVRLDVINDLFSDEKYFLQIDSHIRFKDNWDNILINQLESMDSFKTIITTYPNEFHYPDPDLEYLDLSCNAPLKFERFLTKGKDDNRFKTGNKISLEDFIVVDNSRVCAGFLFTRREWFNDVMLPKGKIVYNGEEDYLTYASFLSGWDIKCPSEATVWHNYNWKDRDGRPYRQHNKKLGKGYNDVSVTIINDLIFNGNHERSVEDLEKYLGIELKRKEVKQD